MIFDKREYILTEITSIEEWNEHMEWLGEEGKPDCVYENAVLWDGGMGSGIVRMNDGTMYIWE